MPGRYAISAVLAVLAVRFVAPAIAAAPAQALIDDDRDAQAAMALGVRAWLEDDLELGAFDTGSSRFDGEWLFGTYMLSGVGLAQAARAHPEWRQEHAELIDRCIEALLSRRVRAFDRDAWGRDPLDALGSHQAHVAYLGYLNLVLSLHRDLDPDSRHAHLNDRITAHLVRLSRGSPTGLLETYPGEVYPVDNSVFIASVAVHDLATDADHHAFLGGWCSRLPRFRDPDTGLLYQRVDGATGRALDRGRGSGTAFAAWFLSFADSGLSADLHRTVRDELFGTFVGFGVTREYARGVLGLGDIDSGPVVLGFGVSATGFTLASARAQGDDETFRRAYATAQLFGAPVDRGGKRRFALGGPIGDAMMFALTTARPAREWRQRWTEDRRTP